MSNMRAASWRKAALLRAALIAACGFVTWPLYSVAAAQAPVDVTRVAGEPDSSPNPAATVPADKEGLRVYRAAQNYSRAKILVSTEDRWLWFVVGKDTLLSAPVGIGMGTDFEYGGKKFNFSTPRGRRSVLNKEENPIWTVPEWHYLEKASLRGLDVVKVRAGEIYPLADGTWIEVRDGQVGRVNQFGNFWPFTPGVEIIFEDKLFVPPVDTPQRRVPNALGPYKLDMGEGYLIHGTHEYNEDTIGDAASHGCVRMRNEDVERLYSMVEPGTAVFIF